jgi:hypothetical protein
VAADPDLVEPGRFLFEAGQADGVKCHQMCSSRRQPGHQMIAQQMLDRLVLTASYWTSTYLQWRARTELSGGRGQPRPRPPCVCCPGARYVAIRYCRARQELRGYYTCVHAGFYFLMGYSLWGAAL